MITFVKLRELMATNIKLREKVEAMERKYDKQLRIIFEVIKRLLIEEKKPKREIGFKVKR